MAGFGGGAGAVLTFGLGPLAHADEFDVILDPIVNAITGSFADSLATLDPAPAADLGAVSASAVDAATNTGGLGLTGVNSALTSAADAARTASSSDSAVFFDAAIYQPLYTLKQDWITSSFGTQVDDAINQGFGEFLIGNGTNGIADGTLAQAAGDSGGLLFGDGGTGATDAGGVGGVGGNAGDFGDGGAGGIGADGGSGGDGGGGGNAGTPGDGGSIGNGGNGGPVARPAVAAQTPAPPATAAPRSLVRRVTAVPAVPVTTRPPTRRCRHANSPTWSSRRNSK